MLDEEGKVDRRRAGGPELHAHADRDVHGRGERGRRPAARLAATCRSSAARTPSPSCRTPSGCGSSCRSPGYKLPKDMDRKAIQALLDAVKGKPEAFAINLAVLKSLTRAEYSPEHDRPLRAGERALLPLHQPDPPLRRPDDPPPARRLLRRHATRPAKRRARPARAPQGQARGRPDATTTSSSSASTSASPSAAPRTPSASCGR